MTVMSAVHKEVHEWTREQQQIWQDAEQVCAMFGEQKEADNRDEDQHYNSSARSKPTALSCFLIVIHETSEPFLS